MGEQEITIDLNNDTVRLFGVTYSLDLFRTLALGPIGSAFRIKQREDEVVILEALHLPEGFDG